MRHVSKKNNGKEIRLFGHKWLTHERWGLIHPDKPHWYYDSASVVKRACGGVDLKLRNSPAKVWSHEKRKFIDSKFAAGLISCKSIMSYGRYTATITLPNGANNWPAFWMWSWAGWPPEIDIMEAYTNSWGNYFAWPSSWCPLRFKKIESNLHYNHGDPKSIGAQRHRIGQLTTRKPIEFELLWTPEIIIWKYNGRTVRTCENPEILDELNKHPYMNVVINNGARTDKAKESTMTVHDFEFKELEK